jgi:hypothetical protein
MHSARLLQFMLQMHKAKLNSTQLEINFIFYYIFVLVILKVKILQLGFNFA